MNYLDVANLRLGEKTVYRIALVLWSLLLLGLLVLLGWLSRLPPKGRDPMIIPANREAANGFPEAAAFLVFFFVIISLAAYMSDRLGG